jgi:hypothetical protein
MGSLRKLLGALTVVLIIPTGACGLLEAEIAEFGVVKLLQIEGGCWVIEGEEETYLPTLLPVSLRIPDLRVQFEAKSQPGLSSFCPGTIVELIWIEEVTAGDEGG